MAWEPQPAASVDLPHPVVRWVHRLQGRPVVYGLDAYRVRIDEISSREPALRGLTDGRLRERADAMRACAQAGPASAPESGATLLEVYALVREVARRTLGMRPFDVQIAAAIALHEGALVEMQTGEGKTLAAVMPAVLNGLTGEGVHLLTFNDYLARRDADWMGPIYAFLGLEVGVVEQGMSGADRRLAYARDVTYVTAKEAGFDYLRDGLCYQPADAVHRNLHRAIVDEADSILIDEARIPLVIATQRDSDAGSGSALAAAVRDLERGVHYATDENERNAFLTEHGIEWAEQAFACGDLFAQENTGLLTQINLALHAEGLLERDKDYIVRSGRVELVDEFTGRVVIDRHWPDGLQAAVEAKEGLRQRDAGYVLSSITLQHFLRTYSHLCGMTATARPEEEELHEAYGLRVVVLPPNVPSRRIDRADRVFTHRSAKHAALVNEIERVHATGRPILVGTASVEESEALAGRLERAGIESRVLNAKNDEREAVTIAEAGALGAITISTNMAGRGTDIRLGGVDERDRGRVCALGGLYVIGCSLHESRRIDWQLRGRAGRQGDPGSTRLFVSLEDSLIERYDLLQLIPEDRRKRSDDPIDTPVINFRIGWAQRVIEGQSFDIRRTLERYSDLVERQRENVQNHRRAILFGQTPAADCASANPRRYDALMRVCDAETMAEIERRVSLRALDELWSDYLAAIAELRESVYMVRLGGQVPEHVFARRAGEVFRSLEDGVDERVARILDCIEVTADGVELNQPSLRGPSSTWSYLVSDDPFASPGGLGIGTSQSIGAALMGPFVIAFGIYLRWRRRRDAIDP